MAVFWLLLCHLDVLQDMYVPQLRSASRSYECDYDDFVPKGNEPAPSFHVRVDVGEILIAFFFSVVFFSWSDYHSNLIRNPKMTLVWIHLRHLLTSFIIRFAMQASLSVTWLYVFSTLPIWANQSKKIFQLFSKVEVLKYVPKRQLCFCWQSLPDDITSFYRQKGPKLLLKNEMIGSEVLRC